MSIEGTTQRCVNVTPNGKGVLISRFVTDDVGEPNLDIDRRGEAAFQEVDVYCLRKLAVEYFIFG
jgi:hypothetical protein